jgi:hypothetical protein
MVGMIAYNLTDFSEGVITANTETQISATLSGGTDNDWDTGDLYAVATPRFGNPDQPSAANRPVVTTPGLYQQAEFTKASSQFMRIPLDYKIPANVYTIVFDYLAKAASGNDHPIIEIGGLSVWRRDSSGDFMYRHGATEVAGSGDMAAGLWVFWGSSTTTAELIRNGTSELSGSNSVQEVASGSGAGRICLFGTDYCDIILRGVAIWNRRLSSREVDLIEAGFDPSASHSSYTRGAIVPPMAVWADDTGATAEQVSRINPTTDAGQRFYRGTSASGVKTWFQLSAAVDGVVLPDSGLGGDLFSMACIEFPYGGHPTVNQDAGWSAVWDVGIVDPGHYTFAIYRENSGTQVLHFDVAEV